MFKKVCAFLETRGPKRLQHRFSPRLTSTFHQHQFDVPAVRDLDSGERTKRLFEIRRPRARRNDDTDARHRRVSEKLIAGFGGDHFSRHANEKRQRNRQDRPDVRFIINYGWIGSIRSKTKLRARALCPLEKHSVPFLGLGKNGVKLRLCRLGFSATVRRQRTLPTSWGIAWDDTGPRWDRNRRFRSDRGHLVQLAYGSF